MWAQLVDQRLVDDAPEPRPILRGKIDSRPVRRRDIADDPFEQPHWRSACGFVSIWPSRWPPAIDDDEARVLFFRYVPGTLDGDPWTELTYRIATATAAEVASDITDFLVDGSTSWRHPQNLRGARLENDTFVADLIHEFGHAVAAAEIGQRVDSVILTDIEVVGDAVNVTKGGSVERWFSTRPSGYAPGVVNVAGLVAEKLHTDPDESFIDPVGLFFSNPECLSDLEGAISEILHSKNIPAMGFDLRNAYISLAIAEARNMIRPRLAKMKRAAKLWKAKIIASQLRKLEIAWDSDESNWFGFADL